MSPKRAFISFDYDNDEDLRVMLAGQAAHPDTPFNLHDWSVKDHLPGDWKAKVRTRIRQTDLAIIICGENTHNASGVAAELAIIMEEGKPYFLLWGRSGKTCKAPSNTPKADQIYKWTWENLKSLVGGGR